MIVSESSAQPYAVNLFDSQKIYFRYVHNRRLFYLDNNIWIELTDGKTQLSQKCLQVLRSAKAQKAILCPLSYISIVELLEHPDKSQRLAQARIMDELCDGVSFRIYSKVAAIEAEAACPLVFGDKCEEIDRSRIFTHVFDFTGTNAIQFSAEWCEGDAKEFVNMTRNAVPSTPVEWLISHLPLERLQAVHQMLEQVRMSRSRDRIKIVGNSLRQKNGKLDYDKILFRERTEAFNQNLPLLRNALLKKYGLEQTLKQIRNLQGTEGGPKKLEQCLSAMPSLELFCEIMAERIRNPSRTEKPEDFYDNLHARIAPAYVDVFVTGDGNLRDLLTNRCKLPSKRGCRVIGTLEELATEVEKCVTIDTPH